MTRPSHRSSLVTLALIAVATSFAACSDTNSSPPSASDADAGLDAVAAVVEAGRDARASSLPDSSGPDAQGIDVESDAFVADSTGGGGDALVTNDGGDGGDGAANADANDAALEVCGSVTCAAGFKCCATRDGGACAPAFECPP